MSPNVLRALLQHGRFQRRCQTDIELRVRQQYRNADDQRMIEYMRTHPPKLRRPFAAIRNRNLWVFNWPWMRTR